MGWSKLCSSIRGPFRFVSIVLSEVDSDRGGFGRQIRLTGLRLLKRKEVMFS